jgi:Holliday junction resolvase
LGKASRDKGARGERLFVRLLQEQGIAAERIPLSGAAGGSFTGDITVPVMGIDRKFECKLRADGFKEIYKWLEGNTGLFLKSDRRTPLVVLRMSEFLDLLLTAEGHKDTLPPTAVSALERLLANHTKRRAVLECSEA